MRFNSVGQPPHRRTLVQIKIGKRRGERPPPKRERMTNQLGASNNPYLDCGTNMHDIHDYDTHSTSQYWQAHLKKGEPDGVPISSSVRHIPNLKLKAADSASGEPHKPAKMARLCEPFSRPVRGCKGNCPPKWTIESYCERCHG